MKTWIWTLLVLVVAIVLGLALREHGGNVLIIAQPWRIELSLTFAVLLIIVGFVLLYFAVRILSWVASGPERLRSWRGWRREKRDHELLEAGWLNVLQGRLTQSEKELSKVVGRTRSVPRKVLAALASARAAHLLGDYARRDEALELARRNAGGDPQLKDATAAVTAEMYLDQDRPGDALVLLQPIHEANSRYFHATRLLLRAHRQLGNHDRVFELARLLLRRGVLDKERAMPMIETAAAGRLRAGGMDGFKSIWGALKADERTLPEVALAAASVQTEAGNHDEAARILEAAIDAAMDPRLLSAYGQCPADQAARRLGKAEAWLKTNPDNFALLAALGHLCLIGKLWGQGERYLLRSMRIRSDVRIHALLGNLYDSLGRRADAMKHWRLCAGVTGALPAGPGAQRLLAGGDATLVDISHFSAAVSPKTAATGAAEHEPDTYFDSAPIPGVGEPEETRQPVQQAASDTADIDEYFDSAPVPTPNRPADDAQAMHEARPDAELDRYFDSAPIPGVDMSKTSDKPQGPAGGR
jgi:HemY protein